MSVSKERKSEDFVPRVSQVDAKELDSELFSLFKSQFLSAFKYMKPDFLSKYEPELNGLLRLILLKFTLYSVEATVGQQLFQLKYSSNSSSPSNYKWKAVVFAAGLIGTHYLQDRTSTISIFLSKYPKLSRFPEILDWIEVILKAASLVNFLVFLQQGYYLTLLERVVGLRSCHAVPPSIRQVGYEYMTRELLWHGFAEFLAFILSLINLRRIKSGVKNFFNPVQARNEENSKWRDNRTEDDISSCGICANVPCLPHEIGCRHVFCYYCIKSNAEADNQFTCPICGFINDSGINYLILENSVDMIR